MGTANRVKLDVLRRQVENWRRESGGRGSRIPEELWSTAVSVAKVEGVYATARALRFDYARLKQRCEGLVVEGAPKFVALDVGPREGAARDQRSPAHVVVELVRRQGDRMRVEVSGPGAVDVLSMAQAFWSQAS